MNDETRDPVDVGIRQIEDLIRGGHTIAAAVTFDLTASGLAPHANPSQTTRLRQLAKALEVDASFLEGCPCAEVEVAQASRFGMH